MRVRLLDELWITKAPDGTLELGVPTATRRGGGSAPGVVTPTPEVVKRGALIEIDLRVYAFPMSMLNRCAGCDEIARAELGERFPKDHVFQHNHGRR